MSLKKIFVTSYAFIVFAVIGLAILTLLMSRYEHQLNAKYELRYHSYLLADQLRQSSDDLTRTARTYVVTGDEKYANMYWDIVAIRNGEQARPQNYHRIYWDFVLNEGDRPRPDAEAVPLHQLMSEAGFTEDEFAKLEEAQKNSDDLITTETIAMKAMQGLFDDGHGNYSRKAEANIEMAQRLMHDETYHRQKAVIMKPIDEFFVRLDERTQAEVDEYAEKTHQFLLIIQILSGCLIVFCISIGVVVTRYILRQVGGDPADVVAIVKDIAEGRLTHQTAQTSVGILAATQKMAVHLRQVVSEVQTAANNIASAGRLLKENSGQLSHAATIQAAASEEASSSIEEMAANIRQNAENAFKTENIAKKVTEDAQINQEASTRAINAMREIMQRITTVEDISRQTRMLSLNATIEAARAQEAGQGFAVVASEVRTLAARSQTAATEINQLTSSTLSLSEQAGEMLSRLVPQIQETSTFVREISAASREQNSGAEQISKAIQQLDHVNQQNSLIAHGVASSADELERQAIHLLNIVAFFETEQKKSGIQTGNEREASPS